MKTYQECEWCGRKYKGEDIPFGWCTDDLGGEFCSEYCREALVIRSGGRRPRKKRAKLVQ